MTIDITTPWHRESYDRFVNDRLPQLIAERLPLDGYHVEPADADACRISISLASAAGGVTMVMEDVPRPDTEGVFTLDGERRVVAPIADRDELDIANIACVGEQLYDYCSARLGEGHADLPWDETLLRAWLPLDVWMRDFLTQRGSPLDTTNWLARCTQLRRLYLPGQRRELTPGHFGRVCPVETPEGPNVGKVLVIAVGAAIRDGKLIVVDDRPEATLGLAASMIPFLEHNELMRLLMGANMMRQWLTPPDPEPALVQTGAEPDTPEFHCGRNLLTAYISWGADTFEDALLISESCAKRLSYPRPVEPGDKLSNRFGVKGVVSRIAPDDEMPHLEDGTPVEIVYHFTGLISRLDFGQIREALMGRIAHREGKPAIVPPFHAPDEQELRARMAQAGLSPDGMEILTAGSGGPKLDYPAMVGYVYWGKLVHTAREKMQVCIRTGGERLELSDSISPRDIAYRPQGQWQGDMEYAALRDLGAFEVLREQFNTRSDERADAGTLVERVVAGPVAQAGPLAPPFAELQRRLAVAGIRAELTEEGLTFQLAPPEGETLQLAAPIPHPYLRERELTHVGAFPELREYAALVEANAKAGRMIVDRAPDSLRQRAIDDLKACTEVFFDALITPNQMRFDGHVLFSGRAVVAPGPNLRSDQAALPEEMAWGLFGPLAARELGGMADVQKRSKRAAQALDAVMARSWIILNRAPTTAPTNLLAFHAVRNPDPIVRLHPAVCNWLDADFDGDQIAVFLPITEEGQREAGDRLSVSGYLTHNPLLFSGLLSLHEALLGLATLTLRPEGRQEFAAMTGMETPPAQYLTKSVLLDVMQGVLKRDGTARFLDVLEHLLRRGLVITKQSGMSLGPFPASGLSLLPAPNDDDPDAWQRYREEVAEQLLTHANFADAAAGPLLLAYACGARGGRAHVSWLIGVPGVFTDVEGKAMVIRHNLRDGLTPEEFFVMAAGSRAMHVTRMEEWEQVRQTEYGTRAASGPYVMARAMRSPHPGIVFARAAACNEVDPLNELNTRLFVGLPAK